MSFFHVPQQVFEQIREQVFAFVVDPKPRIAGWFSKLKQDKLTITGHITKEYNCIAWAAGDTSSWWWPTIPEFYWPEGVPDEVTLEAFVLAFRTLGYKECSSPEVERNYEKIAIFIKNGIPSHASRQCSNGRWSSKIGKWELIEHEFNALEGNGPNEYGQIVQIMRRRKPTLWRRFLVSFRSKFHPEK